MTKEVLVLLRGLQFARGDAAADNNEAAAGNIEAIEDNNNIETAVAGTYYEKNGNHYVLYDEAMEGFSEPVKNKVKFGTRFLELSRSGTVNAHMVFEENKKHMTNYRTPYGNIPLGIDTKKIHIAQQPDRIIVNVEYVLDMNDEYLSDCKIVIDIRPNGIVGK